MSFLYLSNAEQARRKALYVARRSALFWKHIDGLKENPQLKDFIAESDRLNAEAGTLTEEYNRLNPLHRYARRIQFLREVLGMQRALAKLNSTPELKVLGQLEACEATPF